MSFLGEVRLVTNVGPGYARGPRVASACSLGMLLLGLAGAFPAQAQSTLAPFAGGWMSSWPDGPPLAGIAPSIWHDGHDIGFTLGGSVAIEFDRSHVRNPRTPNDRGRILLELGGSGERLWRSTTPSAGMLAARLHWVRERTGAWFGYSGFEPEQGGSRLPMLGTGVWAERGRFMVATQAVQLLRPLRVSQIALQTPAPADSNRIEALPGVTRQRESEDLRRLTGAETSIAWNRNHVVLQSRFGVALSDRRPPARWGELWAGYWLRPGLAVFGRARGAAHVPAALEAVRGSQAVLGIQFAPSRELGSAIRLRPAGDRGVRVEGTHGDLRRLVFRIAASRLEVSSDALGWSPVEARKLGTDRWEAELELAAGVHRVALRIDGGPWTAPPGLPVATDDFGGQVGLLVIP